MKNFITTMLTLLLSVSAFAQYRGKVYGTDAEDQMKTEALFSAFVIWDGTSHGTITDMDGSFEIDADKQSKKLTFQYVGYVSQTIDVSEITDKSNIVIKLIPEQLDEVTVTQRKLSSSINRRSAMLTQDLGKDELCKAPCCNLGESFETNASVDVNYADATTGARTIQLLGLSGRYVQMLSENIPNLRGIAAPFGLSYVPGTWMDGISISKGVGTVVNGYEAITGQINYEYKKPISEEICSASLFGTTSGRGEVNASVATRLREGISTAFIVSATKDFDSMDENKDNFRDEPQTKQLSLLNRWNFHRNNYTGQIIVKTMNETRMGGQMDFNSKTPVADMYGVYIKTDRVESWLKNGFSFEDDANLGIQTAYIYHHQNSFFGNRLYKGTQHSYYFNALFRKAWEEDTHTFDAGISSQGDMYNENVRFNESSNILNYSLNDISFGAYAQYTLSLEDMLSVIAGVRADYDTEFKSFVTPRLNVRYAPHEFTVLRAGIGKGYRTAALLGENNYMLSSAREWLYNDKDVYSQESAWNMGGSIQQTVGNTGLSINAEYYHTKFINQLVLDTDRSVRQIFAANTDNESYANTVQIEASYRFKGLDITAAWRWNEAKQTLNNELCQRPLVSRYKGLLAISYQTPLKTWQFDANIQLNGGGRIPTTIDNPIEYQRNTSFGSYQMYNAQITKWFRNWSIYAGCENIGNYMQEDAIIAADKPMSNYFDGTMIWGPLMSRKFYLGVRFSLEQ